MTATTVSAAIVEIMRRLEEEAIAAEYFRQPIVSRAAGYRRAAHIVQEAFADVRIGNMGGIAEDEREDIARVAARIARAEAILEAASYANGWSPHFGVALLKHFEHAPEPDTDESWPC